MFSIGSKTYLIPLFMFVLIFFFFNLFFFLFNLLRIFLVHFYIDIFSCKLTLTSRAYKLFFLFQLFIQLIFSFVWCVFVVVVCWSNQCILQTVKSRNDTSFIYFSSFLYCFCEKSVYSLQLTSTLML